MPRYRLSDGATVDFIEAADLEEAKRKAEEWLSESVELSSTDDPIWMDGYVVLVGEDDEPVEVEGPLGWRYVEEATVRVRIDPPEPACTSEEGHDWQSPWEVVGGLRENPGVWGNGGGVRIHEVCSRCGWHRIEDTWFRDDRGQPTAAVLYREPDEDSLAWVHQCETE